MVILSAVVRRLWLRLRRPCLQSYVFINEEPSKSRQITNTAAMVVADEWMSSRRIRTTLMQRLRAPGPGTSIVSGCSHQQNAKKIISGCERIGALQSLVIHPADCRR